MKKVLFYLSLVLAVLLVAWTRFTDIAVDIASRKQVMSRSLIITIPLAVVLAAGYIVFFRKTFPKAWGMQKKAGQVLIGVFFLLGSLFVTILGTETIDIMLPYKKKEQLGGVVINKHVQKNGRSKQYLLRILYLHAGGSREFFVKRKIYDRFGPGDHITSWFYTGPFGTQYTRIR